MLIPQLKRLLLLSLLILPTMVTAQEPSYTITMPLSKWRVVGDGLGEIPLKTSGPIVQEINTQINTQIEVAKKVEADKAAADKKEPEVKK